MTPRSPNLPPEGWQPTQLWGALCERPKPSAALDLPIKNYRDQPFDRIRMLVLRNDEKINARVAGLDLTVAKMRERFKDFEAAHVAGNTVAEELLQTYSALETLALAVVTVDGVEGKAADGRTTMTYGRHFRSSTDINRVLHEDEISTLWAQYLSVQRERGPLVTSMTGEEVEAWIAVLKDAADALPLARLTWPALATLCLCLAQRAGSSTGSSLDLSQSEESPNGPGFTAPSAPIGTFLCGGRRVAPGLATSTPDDGTTPIGADPEDAAYLVRSLETD